MLDFIKISAIIFTAIKQLHSSSNITKIKGGAKMEETKTKPWFRVNK